MKPILYEAGQYGKAHVFIMMILFVRCVYLFSENLDIHACFMGGKVPNQTWATPAFKKLRLMDRLRNTVPPGMCKGPGKGSQTQLVISNHF